MGISLGGGPNWADIVTAVGTAVLAVFAIVTAVLAGLAFLKQSREVRAVERQVADGQETGRQQGEILKVQAGQLEVLRAQLEDQRDATAKQAQVLELQAAELRESLDERKRAAAERRRAQASRVFLTELRHPYIANSAVISGGIAYVKARSPTAASSRCTRPASGGTWEAILSATRTLRTSGRFCRVARYPRPEASRITPALKYAERRLSSAMPQASGGSAAPMAI
jgi:hypothetical protein